LLIEKSEHLESEEFPMKKSTLALLFVSCIASNAFAAWSIECAGGKNSTMTFTSSSFSGKPTLFFESLSLYFDSSGREKSNVEVVHDIHDGGMFAIGIQMNLAGGFRQRISFYIPALNVPNGSSNSQLHFDTEVKIATVDGRCGTSHFVQMQCAAQNVNF
jgi:hypothetical protein